MTPPPSRGRRRADGSATPARGFPRRGAVRRAQAITTYGVGSLIAVEQESFIVSGIDSAEEYWPRDEAPVIHEPRLARVLGVRRFRLPPASGDASRDGVRVRRFPLWHHCPECHALDHVRKFNSPPGRNECAECSEPLVPSRFVVACEDGHLADFPYWKWLHRGRRGDGQAGFCGGRMTLASSGRTSSLRSVVLSCSCGVPEVSMEGSFRRGALKDLNIRCDGRRPWLRDAPDLPCSRTPRTLQRGSSSVWQPVLRSALSIPPWSDTRAHALDKHWDKLRTCSSLTEIEIHLKYIFDGTPPPVTPEEVMTLLAAMEAEDTTGDDNPDVDQEQRYRALRDLEYARLCEGHPEGSDHRTEQFVCEPPTGDAKPLTGLGLATPMLVKKLREVRALKAFTRVIDPETSSEGHEAKLSLAPTDWLPAMEVHGEGVFLRLDEDRIDAWAELPAVAERVERIRHRHQRVLTERASDPTRVPVSPATPRMALLHTFAHVMIDGWSLDSGYPSASLRERIYSGDDMAGVLIYTATSDSAGSLGGLVAQGETDRLAQAVRSAVHRAEWCSADPLCVETETSGAGGTNLAACHACVMLPETSCEYNNGLLDRALLVGTPEDPSIGFFSHLLTR
ncbi:MULTISPECIES: DrmB family protein [unclassified Streptomyces]|uniref:DrmB family protein n=1 Tax=unclassified Streptomyces TaxID=2593676 RepID=UPI00364B85CA